LILRKQLASKLCADAVNLMIRTAGSSSLKNGTQIERYSRDMNMVMTHPTVQIESNAALFGRLYFETGSSFFATPGIE
jgi:hypothetical protein